MKTTYRIFGTLFVAVLLLSAQYTLAQTDAERATGLYSRYETTLMTNPAGGSVANKQQSPLSVISSDDFSAGVLNTSVWTFINPGTPSTLSFTGTGTPDARLSIAVPAGSSHDAWTGGNNTPRIMQAAPNSDFEV